ncbi:hypothetical protein RI065_08430 [Mycoplasmatota bacterium zrk1]
MKKIIMLFLILVLSSCTLSTEDIYEKYHMKKVPGITFEESFFLPTLENFERFISDFAIIEIKEYLGLEEHKEIGQKMPRHIYEVKVINVLKGDLVNVDDKIVIKVPVKVFSVGTAGSTLDLSQPFGVGNVAGRGLIKSDDESYRMDELFVMYISESMLLDFENAYQEFKDGMVSE